MLLQINVRKYTILLIMFVSVVQATESVAPRARSHDFSGLPSHYPSQFQGLGVLQKLEDNKREVIINAQKYRLDSNTRYHTLNKQFGGRSDLKVNMNVGFHVKQSAENPAVIYEIWILPQGRLKQY